MIRSTSCTVNVTRHTARVLLLWMNNLNHSYVKQGKHITVKSERLHVTAGVCCTLLEQAVNTQRDNKSPRQMNIMFAVGKSLYMCCCCIIMGIGHMFIALL